MPRLRGGNYRLYASTVVATTSADVITTIGSLTVEAGFEVPDALPEGETVSSEVTEPAFIEKPSIEATDIGRITTGDTGVSTEAANVAKVTTGKKGKK